MEAPTSAALSPNRRDRVGAPHTRTAPSATQSTIRAKSRGATIARWRQSSTNSRRPELARSALSAGAPDRIPIIAIAATPRPVVMSSRVSRHPAAPRPRESSRKPPTAKASGAPPTSPRATNIVARPRCSGG
jgi:hypothetical protein